ncbi:hypothetical protein B0H16DRAFT_1693530 [Mycena metata]|uniref:Uncharacterized protein n=1 Tax=Mycena metata TaxID=1033252 RepID=A0AAD7N3Z2_9AGAR|nr:hypothetical protein B0H16DRAFT_1693530 [Mycena metata]
MTQNMKYVRTYATSPAITPPPLTSSPPPSQPDAVGRCGWIDVRSRAWRGKLIGLEKEVPSVKDLESTKKKKKRENGNTTCPTAAHAAAPMSEGETRIEKEETTVWNGANTCENRQSYQAPRPPRPRAGEGLSFAFRHISLACPAVPPAHTVSGFPHATRTHPDFRIGVEVMGARVLRVASKPYFPSYWCRTCTSANTRCAADAHGKGMREGMNLRAGGAAMEGVGTDEPRTSTAPRMRYEAGAHPVLPSTATSTQPGSRGKDGVEQGRGQDVGRYKTAEELPLTRTTLGIIGRLGA